MKTHPFPPSFLALSLVLLFVFLGAYPVVLLGAKPFLMSLWHVLLELAQGKGLSIPFHFTVKGLAFALLGVGSLTLLRLRLEVAYLSHWSLTLSRPHSLHVDYNPLEPESVYALGRWGVYRFLQITALPLGIFCVMGASLYLQFWFLNTFLEAPFMDFPLIYMIGIFWIFLLGFLGLLALVYALWQAVASSLGACVVVSEPLQRLPVIWNRCKRLMLYRPSLAWQITAWWLLDTLLHGAWLALSVWLLGHYDLKMLWTPLFPWLTILGGLVMLWSLEGVVKYRRFILYHTVLGAFYNALPQEVKAAYKAPKSFIPQESPRA